MPGTLDGLVARFDAVIVAEVPEFPRTESCDGTSMPAPVTKGAHCWSGSPETPQRWTSHPRHMVSRAQSPDGACI